MSVSAFNGIKEASGLIEVSLDREREAQHGWERAQEYEMSRQSELLLKRRVPLPRSLFEQYSHLECKSFMGIFPEIHRAWFTVDNRLFLWNYATGADFYPYEGVDQIITAAAIVKPRPGVFIEDVQYLLALSTPVEVVLLGVCFSGPSVSSEITLVQTQMVVTTDNVAMLKMVGSRNHRLFMAGRDGCLHELTYQGDLNSFWSFGSRKARKLNHSKNTLMALVPATIKVFFSGDDPLVDLVVDDTRDILYSLSESGTVTAYDIGKMSRASKIASADAVADARRYSPASNVRDRAFLSLAVVPLHVSSTTQLVVMTTLGERIYYSLRASRGPMKTLLTTGFRGTPPLHTDAFRPSVHTCAWIRGALFLADARNGDTDTLVVVVPERSSSSRSAESYRYRTSSTPVEVVAETPLDQHGGFAKAWAISEAPSAERSTAETPKDVIVLTNAAIQLYSRLEPRDKLEKLVTTGGRDLSDGQITDFFNYYGRAEACAICLSLATSRNSSPEVVAGATRLFFSKGGNPSFEDEDREVTSRSHAGVHFDIGRPSASPPPLRFSGAHDGLCLHIARNMSRIWWTHVTTSRRPDDYQALNFNKDDLLVMRERMEATLAFLERNWTSLTKSSMDGQFSGASRPTGTSQGPQSIQEKLYRGLLPKRRLEEAKRLEQISIGNLKSLTQKISEALALLSLLGDHQFHRLAASLNPQSRHELVRLRFCELFVSESGAYVCNALLEGLFASYADQPSVVDALTYDLREKCKSFFGDAEVAMHRGITLVRRAARTSGPEAMNLAVEAVRELKPFAGRIVDLFSVCAQLKTVGAVVPMAELISAAAAAAETNGDRALLESASKAAFETVDVLIAAEDPSRTRLKDTVMRIFTENPSEEFVVRLYEALIQLGPLGAEEVFNWPSARLQKYLENSDPNLLWRYFAKHGRHYEAAIVLCSLAEDPDNKSTLTDRIGNLASAVHNAKVANASASEPKAASLLREVSDKLEVAQVQLRTREELKRRRGDDRDASKSIDELSSKLLDLSTLYNNYARPWELWESELDALRCAAYRDDTLVKRLWKEIIDAEITASPSSPANLSLRMATLGRDYYPSATTFPVPFLIEALEAESIARLDKPAWSERKGWVARTMVEIGVPRKDIISAYGQILDRGELVDERSWDNNSSLFLIRVIAEFLAEWVDLATRSDSVGRELSAGISEVSKTVSTCRSLLRTMTDEAAVALIRRLDATEAKAERVARQP